MNEPTTVTYPIAEVLKRIENKLDKIDQKFEDTLNTLQKDVNTKLEKLNTVEVKLVAIETEVKNLNKDVGEFKGVTKAQIWTLIGILVTAVSGFLVAVARFCFLSSNLNLFLRNKTGLVPVVFMHPNC